jgi:putative endonuclease
MTNNFQRRIKQHNNDENSTTKAYRPFELTFGEEYNTRVEAREREKYLKSGIGKEFIKSFLK